MTNSDVAEEFNLSLFLCNSDKRAERELAYLTRLQQQRVQGILITPASPEDASLDEIVSRGTPLVIVDRRRAQDTHCSVSVDDELGGRIAVEHLFDAGHERIAFIGGPARLGQVRDRHQGALAAAAASGRSASSVVWIETANLTVGDGRNAGERLAGLPSSRRPTAAFCANDLVALGLLQKCVALGLKVPEDLAIVGYDDIEFASAAAIPLTSVRQPRRQLGRAAAELLLDESTNPDHWHQQVLFTPELVARASSLRS